MQSKTLATLLLVYSSFGLSAHEYQLQWQQPFSQAEHDKISQWLALSATATTTLLGPYPFTMQLYVYRRHGNEPVPWANTRRDSAQQVHFYVEPRFSFAEFQQDWTAYHEISHLALPYLGAQNAWFAEGFASFMQYQVMQHLGLIDSAESAIAQKFNAQRQHYLNSDSMRNNAVKQLTARRYAAGYWGGAQFFVIADTLLRQQGHENLAQLIQRYQQCCRLRDNNLPEVIISLDTLSDSTLFSTLLRQFSQQPAAAFLRHYQQ
jgi:hypothetical protein